MLHELKCVNGGRIGSQKEKARSPLGRRALWRRSENIPGSDLLSHAPTHAVPSAVAGLTSVFGMGTGVTLLLWPPGNWSDWGPAFAREASRGAWASYGDAPRRAPKARSRVVPAHLGDRRGIACAGRAAYSELQSIVV